MTAKAYATVERIESIPRNDIEIVLFDILEELDDRNQLNPVPEKFSHGTTVPLSPFDIDSII